MGKIFIPNYPLEVKNSSTKNSSNNKAKLNSKDFSSLLEKRKEQLKLSTHAKKRIISRKLNIKSEEIQKVENGVNKLREKGGQDSVVIADGNAYVVSIKNNTVVTIVDKQNLKENIFTNIDSMIML